MVVTRECRERDDGKREVRQCRECRRDGQREKRGEAVPGVQERWDDG